MSAPHQGVEHHDEATEEDQALLPKEEEDDEQTHVPLTAKSGTGGPRWCRKCDNWKPDRCHHCRSCRQCVLKSKPGWGSSANHQWTTIAHGLTTVLGITTVRNPLRISLTYRKVLCAVHDIHRFVRTVRRH